SNSSSSSNSADSSSTSLRRSFRSQSGDRRDREPKTDDCSTPLAEDRGADPDMARAEADRGLVVRAHAHAELAKPMAAGDLAQQREMQRRLLRRRRNAHQPVDGESEAAASLDEAVGLGGRDPGLLRLGAGIHLDQELRASALALDLAPQRLGEPRPVERLDDVEERHGLLDLVGLQRADEMQHEIGMARLE